MMRKKESYTIITPIPACVPRQLALDILHSHSEIITLNPLVLSHHAIPAPRDAIADEYYSTWYEITERVQYVPGLGKMGSGKISFKGCFHNVEWGLQTHMYAPMNIDLQSKWCIIDSQPDEPPETWNRRSDGAPQSGRYLREDIEIECNRTIISFVKNQLKASSKVLVDRLIKKAELLDAGVLHAMMEDGKLTTYNPADLSDRTAFRRAQSFRSGFDSMSRESYYEPRSTMKPGKLRMSSECSVQLQGAKEPRKSMPAELPADFAHSQPVSEKYSELPDNGRLSRSSRLEKGCGGFDDMKENPDEQSGEGMIYRPYRPPATG